MFTQSLDDIVQMMRIYETAIVTGTKLTTVQ